MPVSSDSSGTGLAPIAASQSGTDERRPAATMVRSASIVEPSSSSTPVTTGRRADLVVFRPRTPTPVRKVTAPSASAWRRSTHSKVVRRQAIIVSSWSSSSRSNPVSVGGRSSPKRISVAPSASRSRRMSGYSAIRMLRSRARKAWLWRTWGAPRRSHSNAASALGGISVSSRSITVTSWPARAIASADPSPDTPPPTTTIFTCQTVGASSP